jgi:hypothetical protein
LTVLKWPFNEQKKARFFSICDNDSVGPSY